MIKSDQSQQMSCQRLDHKKGKNESLLLRQPLSNMDGIGVDMYTTHNVQTGQVQSASGLRVRARLSRAGSHPHTVLAITRWSVAGTPYAARNCGWSC